MKVYIVLTNNGIWSVCASRELAEQDEHHAIANNEINVKIQECGVYNG